MEIIFCECSHHPGEFCSITTVSTEQDDQGLPVVCPPFCARDMNMRDITAKVFSFIASNYTLYNRGMEKVISRVINPRIYLEWYKEFYRPKSNYDLSPLTTHKNYLMVTEKKLASFVPDLVDFVDGQIKHLANIRIGTKEYEDYVSVRSFLLDPVKVGDKQYPRVICTTNANGKSTEEKLVSLYKAFSFDAVSRENFPTIKKLITPAIIDLERELRCDSYIASKLYRHNPRGLIKHVKLFTSGGIMDMKTYKSVAGDFRIANSGRKIVLIEAAIRKYHEVVVCLAKGIPFHWQPLNVTKNKVEWLYGLDKTTEEDFEKFMCKCREFYIPCLVLTLLSSELNADRMKFERGALITIGCKPWYGGWYELAVRLNYDNPDIFWVDGDITGLDKHITDWMLYIYLGRGMRYFNWNKMPRSMRTLVKRLYALLMYHVVNKITLQPGTIWRLIRGMMYSGGKETSHGDSWITALLFFLYIHFVAETHPCSKYFIMRALYMGFIAIIVYGDDHIWSCLKAFRHIINAASFAAFLKEYLGMELRDFKEYDKFLSEVNHEKGTLIYQGPKFLKRYFIARTHPCMAPVVPFKPYFESALRMCTVEEEEDIPGLLLKSIGMAWDTYGTNVIMYEVAKSAYLWAVSRYQKSPAQLVQEWRKDPTKESFIRGMEKKIGIKESELLESFPILEDLIQRHVYDSNKNHNLIATRIFF